MTHAVRLVLLGLLLAPAAGIHAQTPPAPHSRPFGTLRQQAAMQQAWLQQRLDTFLPGLMRTHGIDLWVVPMSEYNEDPVFAALTGPETFAARRRTIYVFFDCCAASGTPPSGACVERIALGGTSQGGVYEARRSTTQAAGNIGRGQQAELWGDEQWGGAEDGDRGAQPAHDWHRPIDGLRLLGRPVERRAPGHERGRTGNEILASALGRMRQRNINGTVYSHPIGLNGHGAGPLIGLWDYQDGVPGRGDAKVIPGTWFSIELQATTPVPEWNDQPVRMAQEEDVIVDAAGHVRWALRRQDRLFLVK